MPRAIIEEVPGLRIYDDGTWLFRDVRFSYVHADAPWAKNPEKDTPKYSVVSLLPKKYRQAKMLADKHMAQMLKDRKVTAMATKDKFLRDGDDSGKVEYAGHWTINCSETEPPSVRGPNTKPIPQNEIKKKVKSGYWGDVLVKPWFQDNEHGKKINAGFIAIQVKRQDEVFGDNQTISEEDIDDTFDAAEDFDADYEPGESGSGYVDPDEDEFGGI